MKDKTLLNVLAIKTLEKTGSLRCKAIFNIVFETPFSIKCQILLSRETQAAADLQRSHHRRFTKRLPFKSHHLAPERLTDL